MIFFSCISCSRRGSCVLLSILKHQRRLCDGVSSFLTAILVCYLGRGEGAAGERAERAMDGLGEEWEHAESKLHGMWGRVMYNLNLDKQYHGCNFEVKRRELMV